MGEGLGFVNELFHGGFWNVVVNLLDLLLVYYLIYRLLLLVRGTRTVPMAIGLGGVFLCYLVAKEIGLLTLYGLLEVFMSVVVIFTLIVFQDDIRRALIRVGRFAWFTTAQETQVAEEVIRASATLAAHKTGALIVFERDALLDEFIDAGTRIDAEVTKELITAVFVPRFDNPLHDGALVIRNYRIYQAGAFLPLSANPHLDKSLGTRHRAAVGITEQTDAVVVVVSEEKGSASLCYGGNIARNLEPTSLRKALLGVLAKSKPDRKKDRRRGAARASRAPEPQPDGLEGLVLEPKAPADGSERPADEKLPSAPFGGRRV